MKIVRIFRAAVGDADDMHSIEIACGLSPWTVDGYKSEIARQETAAFIARDDDGDAVGFLIGRVPNTREAAAEIFNIGILPDIRRKGIGNALLVEFLEVCRKRQVSEAWLEVRISNDEAINFYRANGFEASGVRPRFYENPPEDAQLMTLRLIPESPSTK